MMGARAGNYVRVEEYSMCKVGVRFEDWSQALPGWGFGRSARIKVVGRGLRVEGWGLRVEGWGLRMTWSRTRLGFRDFTERVEDLGTRIYTKPVQGVHTKSILLENWNKPVSIACSRCAQVREVLESWGLRVSNWFGVYCLLAECLGRAGSRGSAQVREVLWERRALSYGSGTSPVVDLASRIHAKPLQGMLFTLGRPQQCRGSAMRVGLESALAAASSPSGCMCLVADSLLEFVV